MPHLFFLIQINLNWLSFQTFQMGFSTTLWQLCPVEEGAREDGSHNSHNPGRTIFWWLSCLVLEESARGARTRPEVSGDHEEPGSQICHSGEDERGYITRIWDYMQLNFAFDHCWLSMGHSFSQSHRIHVVVPSWGLQDFKQSSEQEQRKAENEGVTEDDVNEIKNDISAFRQLLDCLPNFT